ncbi:MAG: hypothetical protein FD177_2199 [Desulfovibrionaceae bacterium]|nr:MAG: hypothetical protein FD177_2199 [Desulfovibrionaceae bacterium]
MRILMMLLALSLSLSGCSMFSSDSSSKRDLSGKPEQVAAFLDAGRDKAALVVANEIVAESPEDYQSYLTRNTVHLVLRDYAAARADNDKALEVYNASQQRYPEKERSYRLAKIHESFALTALLASRRTADPAERKRLEAQFAEQSEIVRTLDEETWKNLRGLAGEKISE